MNQTDYLGDDKTRILVILTVPGIACIFTANKPLVYLMKWITLLAGDKYEAPPLKRSFYKGNGKLINPYHFYERPHHAHAQTDGKPAKHAMERDRMDELKREWGAGISHDLRTHLTYIKSYASMLLSPQYGWNDSEKTKFLWEIQQKTEHLEELIQDLNLSFQMDHQNIPLSATSGDIVDFVRRIAADVGYNPRASKHELNYDAHYRGSTTKQKSEGTGLGMANAKQLVLAHQSDISVTSRTNEGTAVEISLPSLSTGKKTLTPLVRSLRQRDIQIFHCNHALFLNHYPPVVRIDDRGGTGSFKRS
ncbi:hypothetical protein BBD40_06215 [Paenibacillus ihbetae]|uniref:histidine kinase n=2 Tax=Paenibacillus ihbetae TaxID=1870820 RepID=A0ABX3JYS1_9BACL|nr:hypothetical protein BBD40_06215 [Paenibacillus ihbetae]